MEGIVRARRGRELHMDDDFGPNKRGQARLTSSLDNNMVVLQG